MSSVVPFRPQPPGQAPRPSVDPTFEAMAAAVMREQAKAKPSVPEPKPDDNLLHR